MDHPRTSASRTRDLNEQTEGIMDQVTSTAHDVTDRAMTLAGEIGEAVRERPYTTLAIAAGMAFALGALWKLGQRPQTGWNQLTANLPDMLSSKDWLPRQWR